MRELLNTGKQLRISSAPASPGTPGVQTFRMDNNPDSIMCYIGQGEEKIYFLPWKRNYGLSLDLPLQHPEHMLFMTAMLSGCSVGVKRLPDCIKVFHFNDSSEEGVEAPLLNADSYRAYGDDVVWLVPDHLSYKANILNIHTYSSAANKTAVFGEYVDGQWTIYYQDNIDHIVRTLF